MIGDERKLGRRRGSRGSRGGRGGEISSLVVCIAHGVLFLAVETAATQTNPTCIGCRSLNFLLIRTSKLSTTTQLSTPTSPTFPKPCSNPKNLLSTHQKTLCRGSGGGTPSPSGGFGGEPPPIRVFPNKHKQTIRKQIS